jgi:DNA polymerase-1
MKRLLLVDVSAVFHRSHSALTRATGGMTNSAGMPITGTFGTINAILSIMDKTEYDSIIPCCEGGLNWRKEESAEYKGNRAGKDVSFYADMSLLIEEVFPALGMNVCKAKSYEADDVIAHIARHSPAYDEIHIMTVDKDILQCVTNKVKVILFSSTKKTELVDIDGVLRHFCVYPVEVRYHKALAGDSSDNVAGIKGIGKKTAVKIIEESRPTGEDGFLSGADRIALHPKVRENAATFLGNLRLVSLDRDVPDLTWFASSPPNPDQVEALFTALEFRSFLKRLPKVLATLKST